MPYVTSIERIGRQEERQDIIRSLMISRFGIHSSKTSPERMGAIAMTQLLEKLADQRIVLTERTWQQFKLIQQGFENLPGVRLSYYDGAIEILMPGQEHEFFKSIIGMLIEQFFLTMGIEFAPTGSVTQEKEAASAQADESYCIGAVKPIPDFSIEVIFTSGSASKLKLYKALGVSEVWFWEDGLFTLHRLRGQSYERILRSEIPELASLDINLLTRCVLMAQTSRLEAVREFCKEIALS